MLKHLIDNYNRLSYTHNYIFGFEYKGAIYYGAFTSEILPFILCVDSASRGCGKCLRYKPNNKQKVEMLPNCKVLCSAEYFNACVKESKYNNGEIFEKMITEICGQNWEKDNVPFTQAGDIEYNGIAYQIKFQKATFINEKQLARLNG
jgi:hypothetical protein